jgi:hypothetical protein
VALTTVVLLGSIGFLAGCFPARRATSPPATSTPPPAATSSPSSRSCGARDGQGRTLLVITHDPAIARRTRRVVALRDGAIEDDRAA